MIITTLLASALASTPVELPIREVVVYEDRGEVLRRGKIACEDGVFEARLDTLPQVITPDSLRARLDGGEVLSLRTELVTRAPDGERAEFEARLSALRRRDRELEDAMSVEQSLLKRRTAYEQLFLQNASEQLRTERPEPGQIVGGLEELRDVGLEHQRELLRLSAEQRDLQQQIEALAESQVGLAEGKTHTEVRLLLECRGRGTLEISYLVPHASWRPEYDLHFAPNSPSGVGAGRYRLGVSAVVRQASGEDWSGVRMRLSTARPRLAADAPMPRAFTLGVAAKSKEKVLVQSQERRPSLERGGQGGEGATAAELSSEGQVVLLTVPHAVDVESDGRERFIPVDVVQGRGESQLVAVPSRSRAVFREVHSRSKAAYPLLPGRARIYDGEALVGQTRIDLVPSGAELRFSLGADPRVRVEREDLVDLSEVRGLFSKSRVLERALRTTVKSEAKKPLTVELRQQIPVSRADDIEVEWDREASFAGSSFDPVRGHVSQMVTVPPGEEVTADLVYSVKLPDDWVVQ